MASIIGMFGGRPESRNKAISKRATVERYAQSRHWILSAPNALLFIFNVVIFRLVLDRVVKLQILPSANSVFIDTQ